jgi:hypothetical protein
MTLQASLREETALIYLWVPFCPSLLWAGAATLLQLESIWEITNWTLAN